VKTRLDKKVAVAGLLAVAALTYFAFLGWSPSEEEVSAEDRRAVLSPPSSDTPDGRKDYRSVVERVAKASDTLTIGEHCSMDPLVLRFTEGATLTVTNTDTLPHTIAFADGKVFVLAPGYKKQLDITGVFGKSAGIHRYRCDDISKEESVGVLLITR